METEKEIFRDLWNYLKTYNNPPTIHDPACEDFWRAAGEDLVALVSKKWHEHQLARKLGPGKTVVTVLPDTAERYFSTPLFKK